MAARLLVAVAALQACAAAPPELPPRIDCGGPGEPAGRVWTEFSDGSAAEAGLPPPAAPPARLRDYYTRCGRAAWRESYVDDTGGGGRGIAYGYGPRDVQKYVDRAERARDAAPGDRPLTMRALFEALDSHPPRGADVIVYGSMTPHVEAACLAYGARSVTTAEHNPPKYHHPKLRSVSLPELDAEVAAGARWDYALALQSFDHDGLGRYGDPLSPDADLVAAYAVRGVLRPGGVFLLSVPVGSDLVVWNMMRRYGRHRLPLLLAGWRRLRTPVLWEDARVDQDIDFNIQPYRPVFVLTPAEGPDDGGGARDEL